MRQALHIFKKDLRRAWPLLLLWAAVLLYWIAPIWRDPLYAEELERIGALGGMLVMFGGVIAAALIIHQDALIGGREFWMTRPIRPLPLMAAKALFVGAFVVLPPILLQFGTLVHYGLPAQSWPLQILELSLSWACVIALACLMAAWTPSLPTFFALFLGLMLLPSFGVATINVFRSARYSLTFAPSILPALGAVALGLLALQYRTRRRGLAVAIAAALLPAVYFGHFRFDPYSTVHRTLTPRLPDMRVELTPGPGRETFAAERPGETAGRAMDLWFVARPVELSPGTAIEISRVDGEIRWSDGSSAPFYAAGQWYLSDGPASAYGLQWAEGRGPESSWRALGIRGDEPFDSLLGRTGSLRGTSYASVWRLAETKTLPLREGAEHEHGPSKTRIVEVAHAPGALEIKLRTRDLVDLWCSYPQMQVALANRVRGETIPLLSSGGFDGMVWGGLLSPQPYSLRTREASWSPRTEWGLGGGEDTLVDAAWLADAELLLTYYDFAGDADIAVEAPNLAIDSIETGSPSMFTSWRAPWY